METIINNLDQYLQNSPLMALVAAFLGGVVTSFTPCVYPMVPITIGIIGAKGAASRSKGFFLSLVYVLGLAVTYSILGIVAALTGSLFGKISTNPIGYFIIANACILFGLSMMGVFDISLPQSSKIMSFLQGRGSGIIMVFLFGLGSGFIAAPCTAPVLAVLLTFAGASGNALFGFLLLFVFALGMGTLLLIVGTFAGVVTSLPKSGKWLVVVQKTMGFFLILVGEYFLIKMGQLLF